MVADMDDGLVAGLARIGFETASKKMKHPAVRLRPFGYSFGKACNQGVYTSAEIFSFYLKYIL